MNTWIEFELFNDDYHVWLLIILVYYYSFDLRPIELSYISIVRLKGGTID